jgi:hypothetical protein
MKRLPLQKSPLGVRFGRADRAIGTTGPPHIADHRAAAGASESGQCRTSCQKSLGMTSFLQPSPH